MTGCSRCYPGMGLLLSSCLAVALGGCRESPRPDPASEPALSAEEVLERMIRAYRQAASYTDHGVVRLKYRQGGQWFEDEALLEVKFARPNRLHLRAYQLTLVSDGRELRAVVADHESADLDRQVLTRPCPSPLPVESLYEDDVVRGVVSGGLGGPPVQLELLLTVAPLQYVFAPQVQRELLAVAADGERDCHRVRVSLPEGVLVFWIDQQNYVLRRLEYPAAQLAQRMAQASECSEVALQAEFRQARFDAPLDDSVWRLELPERAQPVRKFVLPPPPLPSDLLGTVPGDFLFTDLQGSQVRREALLGKVTVLLWFNNHPASQASLEQVSQVQAEFAQEPQVAFRAVCTEPQSLSHAQVLELTRRWGGQLPVVRDLQACGRDVFRVPWAPTLVVLDQRGAVQLFEVGANAHRKQDLPAVIKQVLGGENVAAKILDQVAQEQAAYRKSLAEATPPSSPQTAP